MAYRRRRTFRRRPIRRNRRTAMRRTRMSRPVRSLNNRQMNVYRFNRSSYSGAPLTSFTTDANGQFFGVFIGQGLGSVFTSNSVMTTPQISEFTTLFDQYKILTYSVTFIPRFDSRDTAYGAGTIADIPTIYWVTDQDDATVPTTVSTLMEHPKVRYARMNRPVTLTIRFPCIADSIYSSAVVTGYATRKAPWIDMASTSVQHFGVKYFIQGPPNRDYTGLFDMKSEIKFLVKNPR